MEKRDELQVQSGMKYAMAVYKCTDEGFAYPDSLRKKFPARFDNRPLWQILEEDGVASPETAARIRGCIDAACSGASVCFEEMQMKNAEGRWRCFRVGFVCPAAGLPVSITFDEIEEIPDDSGDAAVSETEIAIEAGKALEEGHFEAYYQPQYNHATGVLVGAEALVRWNHPERGVISPKEFIPVMEKCGLIEALDFQVFEQVCEFQRNCMQKGMQLVAISVNFSRNDIFLPDFVERLEAIRIRYGVPVRYLRVEITESAMAGSSRAANDVVKKLHSYGYIVEMDDCGSGYSSLNMLKDIEVDVLKLDMMFLSGHGDGNRGGTILSSIVRMAKWLELPVIAEGVENAKQADFLRSIGCDYIQGYLYARPMSPIQYEELLAGSPIGETAPQLNLIETLNPSHFWNPESLETLIFSNYVGGAAIFSYHDGAIEILRVNKKYLLEIGMNLSEKELIQQDFMAGLDEANRTI